MVAAITGLAALMHTSAVAFQTLKYVGVAYLLVIAWRTLKEKGRAHRRGDGPTFDDPGDRFCHPG
jgi:threonine/homoserine/homoserine lactone efflux protein